MQDAYETTGNRVRRRREALGKSQQEVAERLSLSIVGYGHYERGRTEFTASQVKTLSRFLQVSVSYLLGEQSEEDFADAEAAIWYNGIPPALKPAAKAALKALYDQADRGEREDDGV